MGGVLEEQLRRDAFEIVARPLAVVNHKKKSLRHMKVELVFLFVFSLGVQAAYVRVQILPGTFYARTIIP